MLVSIEDLAGREEEVKDWRVGDPVRAAVKIGLLRTAVKPFIFITSVGFKCFLIPCVYVMCRGWYNFYIRQQVSYDKILHSY